MSMTMNNELGEKKLRFHEGNKVEDVVDSSPTGRERPPSLIRFLGVELTRGYLLENDEEQFSARRDKVYSFMQIPREVEKFMLYGFLQCADSFLYVLTFLPLRFLLATRGLLRGQALRPADTCDFLKVLILVVCSAGMSYLDTNMLYHMVKSQSVIKLYIFYNMLEVGDRLFSAFGQDIIDALFWTATEPRRRPRAVLLTHILFALAYVFLHSVLVLFQATTLNVALNSNNKALLTIMMSNNFVELKGSVFKKFDKNNLFQVVCSDVRERLHLVALLTVVVLQTMREYAWREDRFYVLLPDCLLVLGVEILVDWIKHAFITRFNELPVCVYRDYTTSLALDAAQVRQKNAFSDHSDLVARRMGFIPLPLGVVMLRVVASALSFHTPASLPLLLLGYLDVCALHVLNSILILGVACTLIDQHRQHQSPGTPASKASAAPSEHTPQQLGVTAIFSNSSVDLKDVCLNEELLDKSTPPPPTTVPDSLETLRAKRAESEPLIAPQSDQSI